MLTIGIGTLTHDPELKPVGNTNVCELILAVSEYRKTKDNVRVLPSLLNFTIWDSAATYLFDHARKGDRIYVEATARRETWTTKEGESRSKIIFRIDNFRLLDRHDDE